MEKNQKLYESMKDNKSLAPIVELGRLVGEVQNIAQQAENLGNTLSVFACKAEDAMTDLPPAEGWMHLCDIYKDGARAFAQKLKEAVDASLIGELQAQMADYTKEVMEKTIKMLEEDEDMRNQLLDAIRNRDKDAENDTKDAE